jgi:Oxidoreductase family, NAD-binding Rossmann fold
MASFAVVGGAGFRAQYYLRIAQAMPDLFRVTGLVVRDQVLARDMAERWRVAVHPSLDDLLAAERPDFVVVSVRPSACAGYLLRLAAAGVPALAETPPAADLAGLHDLHDRLSRRGARVQVAEQYQFHPLNVARAAVLASGRLGRVTQATVSISHLYHAASLIRSLLRIEFEPVRIRGMRFESPWVAGPTRAGPPTADELVTSQRDLAWLDFGDRLGIYDFTGNQHRSWIRSNHLSVRGERGEIFDRQILVQDPTCTPLELELRRVNRGEQENQEGYFLQGILAGEQWVYVNPFAPARLYDDEIAIATCLAKMADHAGGGPGFYGLPDASHDTYLGMLIEQAVTTGESVASEPQPWS